ncbi:ClpXP protease specificity-enhancing factor [Actinobacillus equuli]|uniref:ClpXP protease specificity-enhancing factor n=1 Tax=Actinobacillus equuli TaxID=718 RepID=UPI00244287CE|nr:ClpXP protease specificity-enhancing factor [Actinobacillus equuli]WGE42936.1 ClpXP protease specificity-enhancing factor [Actinobacillus equuli subsp. haemolyticus]WGE47326.1 ClpXP protease specificity-enhancing factor [Actinobacillus equuli subsp. haemolyticus]WGE86308.1 ClpXP protease specificity-enhancing factor [Actinobacillus equuli subsp. haemolyticus]
MKPLRPYLYHAYYSWIIDNDNTPYLLVNTDYPDVDVPAEFIRDGKIILNIAPRSIGQYVVTDEAIRFNARFQGMLRDVYIPLGALEAIYAQETGDGVMFQDEPYYSEQAYHERNTVSHEEVKPKVVKKKTTHLKLVK